MGAKVTDGILDALMDKIAEADRITVLSAEPSSIADITTNYKLASTAMTPGDGNDYTVANGDTSGRKVTPGAQNDVSITASGTATHVALDDGTDYTVTTCTSKALTSGDTVNIPAFDVEVSDPTAS